MVLILGTSVWLIVWEVESAYRQNLTQRLIAQAVTIRHEVRNIFSSDHRDDLQRVAQELGAIREADIRVTIVGQDGTVWADSEADPARMESHAGRPEIIAAMAVGWGGAERRSGTLDRELKYVAVRVDDAEGHALGTVRVAMPIPGIAEQTATMSRLIWQTAAVGLAAAFVLALGLAWVWSKPIQRITEAARSLSRGDLTTRTRVTGGDEIAQMAESLNQMRDSIARQVNTIERQRKNLENLILSLTEGVIVADPEGRIVLMNDVACRFLGTPLPADEIDHSKTRIGREFKSTGRDLMAGRTVEDCIRSPELLRFLSPRISGADPSAQFDESTLPGVRAVQEFRLQVEQPSGTVHLLARCSEIGLPSAENGDSRETTGRLVVLTDITELTKTIRMKTDFVANASHELRTPLSAIRASVETLEQMVTGEDQAALANFIGVIGKHTNRLAELVADLLELSRLEASSAEFHPEDVQLPDLFDDMRARFADSMKSRGLTFETHVPENCALVRVNSRLLRLVLDNLVANAIKFTEPPGHVWITCARLGPSISIEVRDDGCGIPKEDQDRVFERFYQVERARSGSGRQHPGDRGTGLGLSIVRHAVAAMRATILLKSQLGKGTSVTVFIPQMK